MFQMIVDKDTGALPILPYSGGFLEQPDKTMKALSIIQDVAIEKIMEDRRSQSGKG